MTRSKSRSEEAIEFARAQRQGANEFAWTVWQWLRNRGCHRQKFRREFPIGHYTADFCCVELKLIVEIDGEPPSSPDPFSPEYRGEGGPLRFEMTL